MNIRKFISVLSAGATSWVASLAVAGAACAQQLPELRIGAVVSITGPAASLGVSEGNAIKLLEERYGAVNDLPFKPKFVTYDDASDPAKAVNAVRKLIQEDKVHVVLCCTTTPNSMAILNTIAEARTPNISMALASAIVEPVAERRFVFKTAVTDGLMLTRVTEHMVKQKYKRVAFMGLEDAYGEGGLNEFRKSAQARGLEIVAVERFSKSDTNFTPQALRVRQSGADAVYFHAIPPSSALSHEALVRAGFKGAIYQSGGSANQAFVTIGRQSVEGAIVAVGPMQVASQLPASSPVVPVLQDYSRAFNERFGAGKADQFGGYGWDAVNITIASARKLTPTVISGDLNASRAALRDAIETTKDFKAVSGVFTFSPENHLGLERGIYLAVVKDGAFKLLED
ncbi:ABC transporter substrate-binding protein [Variovorax sp. VNK109]|uniref:ABC transporter substrate-binding protein n=1 Tax=Variovorax sp. VNK109 TaxID=3400919 RepID=UPI003C0B44AD